MNLSKDINYRIALTFNTLYTLGIFLLLFIALFLQFYLHEEACPLCLLQRAGFLMTSLGFLLNIRFGLRPSHYVISLLGALFTAFMALRQMFLHIVPGTGSYGFPVFGLHLYTWCFIISILIIIFTCFLLAFDPQYFKKHKSKQLPLLSRLTFILILLVASTNLVTIFAECGLKQCPENPTTYVE